jgi:CMP-N-acetylneuraminic acid synthetase
MDLLTSSAMIIEATTETKLVMDIAVCTSASSRLKKERICSVAGERARVGIWVKAMISIVHFKAPVFFLLDKIMTLL